MNFSKRIIGQWKRVWSGIKLSNTLLNRTVDKVRNRNRSINDDEFSVKLVESAISCVR